MKTLTRESSPAHQESGAMFHAETTEACWKPLYRIGGAAAFLIAVLYVIQMIVFVISPPPGTVIGYFALFHRNAFLGLLNLDLLSLVDYVLFIPLFLALSLALRRVSPSFVAIALTAALVGSASYFASNKAFEMLSLSAQYAAATTEAQRSVIMAAGQAMLAIFQGTAFNVSYILLSVAPLIISVVMLRSNVFGKVTAYVGIVASAIGLGLFVPAIGIFLALMSVIGLMIWYLLIGRRLFQLAQEGSKVEGRQPVV